jgi:hypothetical protein
MAHKMTKRGNIDNIVTYEHFCDTKADMADIDTNEINLGSVCVVLADESQNNTLQFYLAKSDKTWIRV